MIVSATYFFYAYMVVYMEGEFTDVEHMAMMILNFVQFGIAIKLGQCSADAKNAEDHGFNSDQGFSTDVMSGLDLFTLDVDGVNHFIESDHSPFGYFLQMFGLYGQDSSSGEVSQTDSIIASLGIMGASQGYAAYQNWLTFNERWLAESYFDAGTFLGAALVNAAIVLYLVLLAGAVNDAASAQGQ